MMEANSKLARVVNNGETALYVLARKPCAFVNESQLGFLTRLINNIPCELLSLWFILAELNQIYTLIDHKFQLIFG